MRNPRQSGSQRLRRQPSLQGIFTIILLYAILFIIHSLYIGENNNQQSRRQVLRDVQTLGSKTQPAAKAQANSVLQSIKNDSNPTRHDQRLFALNLTENSLQSLARGISPELLSCSIKSPIIPSLTLVSNGSQRGEIWIYKAFYYDESYLHFGGPKYIIILAMATTRKKVSMGLSPTCVLWTSQTDSNPLVSTASAIQTSAHANVIYEKRFIKHVGFRCTIPHEYAHNSYLFVSVFYKAEWLNVTTDTTLHKWLLGYAKIVYSENVQPAAKKDFGYCGSTWYYLHNQSSTDPYRLLEWLDYHAMIGIERFHIALPPGNLVHMQLPNSSMSVLHYFQSRGLVELSEAPVMTKHPGSAWGLVQPLQPLVINDCFLTNRKKYNFIVITDSDEAITINKKFSHYGGRGSSLLRSLINISTWHPTTQRAHSYRMTQYMFFTNCHTLPGINGTKLEKYKINTNNKYYMTKYFTAQLSNTWGKSILSTHQCQTVCAHGCLTSSSIWSQHLIQRTVPKYIARVHHYREALRQRDGGFSYVKARGECYDMVQNSTNWEDNLILPYLDEIKERLAQLETQIFVNETSQKQPLAS